MKITFSDLMEFLHMTYTLVFPIFFTWVINRMKSYHKKRANSDESIKIILRMYLIELHYRNMKQGYATRSEFQTFIDIWQLYHDAYNGNLLSERYMEDMKNLEIWENEKGQKKNRPQIAVWQKKNRHFFCKK